MKRIALLSHTIASCGGNVIWFLFLDHISGIGRNAVRHYGRLSVLWKLCAKASLEELVELMAWIVRQHRRYMIFSQGISDPMSRCKAFLGEVFLTKVEKSVKISMWF